MIRQRYQTALTCTNRLRTLCTLCRCVLPNRSVRQWQDLQVHHQRCADTRRPPEAQTSGVWFYNGNHPEFHMDNPWIIRHRTLQSEQSAQPQGHDHCGLVFRIGQRRCGRGRPQNQFMFAQNRDPFRIFGEEANIRKDWEEANFGRWRITLFAEKSMAVRCHKFDFSHLFHILISFPILMFQELVSSASSQGEEVGDWAKPQLLRLRQTDTASRGCVQRHQRNGTGW